MADSTDVISLDPFSDTMRSIQADLDRVVGYLMRTGTAQMQQELRAGAQYIKATKAKRRILEQLLAEPLKQIPDDAPDDVRKSARNFLDWFHNESAPLSVTVNTSN